MPPPVPPPRERSGNNAATLTAVMLLLACAAGLFFLFSLIVPFALGILVIGVIFIPMTLLHYLVWGRLLEQYNRNQVDPESHDNL